MINKVFIYLMFLFILNPVSAGDQIEMKAIKEKPNLPLLEFSNQENLVNLSKLEGKFILLNFWATWCPSCVSEMPSLDRLATKLNKNLDVVTVSLDEGGIDKSIKFVRDLNLPSITVLYDHNNQAYRTYGIRGLPTTYLISPDKKILFRLEGGAEWDTGKLFNQLKEIVDD